MAINRLPFLYFLVLVTFSMSSCQIVGDIFKAGMWAGLIVVALIIGIIIWVIRRIGGGRRS